MPVALVIAWYHGDRGHQRVTRAELAILVVLLVAGGAVFWYQMDAVDARRGAATVSAQSDDAAEQCRTAIELDPLFPVAIELLGAIESAAGRYQDAEKQYRRAIVVDPSRPAGSLQPSTSVTMPARRTGWRWPSPAGRPTAS